VRNVAILGIITNNFRDWTDRDGESDRGDEEAGLTCEEPLFPDQGTRGFRVEDDFYGPDRSCWIGGGRTGRSRGETRKLFTWMRRSTPANRNLKQKKSTFRNHICQKTMFLEITVSIIQIFY